MVDSAGIVPLIHEIASPEGLEPAAEVVRRGFATVAREFALTLQNNPTHPSFIATRHLLELQTRGFHLFGLFEKENPVGFVALGPLEKGSCSLEKLAVLPESRRLGYGALLVRFGLDYARQRQAAKVVLTLINENGLLKNWYLRLGFVETEVKKFPQLPFTVCFMQFDLRESHTS
jgi:diamine N-acetyltransferase